MIFVSIYDLIPHTPNKEKGIIELYLIVYFFVGTKGVEGWVKVLAYVSFKKKKTEVALDFGVRQAKIVAR